MVKTVRSRSALPHFHTAEPSPLKQLGCCDQSPVIRVARWRAAAFQPIAGVLRSSFVDDHQESRKDARLERFDETPPNGRCTRRAVFGSAASGRASI